jgi:hypothetical protein
LIDKHFKFQIPFNFSECRLAKIFLHGVVSKWIFMWTQQRNGAGQSDKLHFTNAVTACVLQASSEGYSECFKVMPRGLYAISNGRYYRPEQVQVVQSYQFEGQLSSGDNLPDLTTVHYIETSDGLKGTLVHTTGGISDGITERFISDAEAIRKKVFRHNQHEC